MSSNRFVHGHAVRVNGKETGEYRSWMRMRNRCLNSKTPDYKYYGGRGITICERWNCFPNFLEDMGPRPEGMTLERKNNNLGYCPENCKWATRKEQAENQSQTIILELNGECHPISVWADRLGIGVRTLKARRQRGWPVEKILTEPPGPQGKRRHNRFLTTTPI